MISYITDLPQPQQTIIMAGSYLMSGNYFNIINSQIRAFADVKEGRIIDTEILFCIEPVIDHWNQQWNWNGKNEMNLLQNSIVYGNKEAFCQLLDYGASPNVTARNQNGYTIIHLLIKYGHLEWLTRELLARNRDIPRLFDYPTSSTNCTPLLLALSKNCKESVFWLFDHGVRAQKTRYCMRSQKLHYVLEKMLLEYQDIIRKKQFKNKYGTTYKDDVDICK